VKEKKERRKKNHGANLFPGMIVEEQEPKRGKEGKPQGSWKEGRKEIRSSFFCLSLFLLVFVENDHDGE